MPSHLRFLSLKLNISLVTSQIFAVAKICSRPRLVIFLARKIILRLTKAKNLPLGRFFRAFVRDGRIELPTSVWKTDVLPLNYARNVCLEYYTKNIEKENTTRRIHNAWILFLSSPSSRYGIKNHIVCLFYNLSKSLRGAISAICSNHTTNGGICS